MASLISAVNLNNIAQSHMFDWVGEAMKDRWLWVDRYMKKPLMDLIYYNDFTIRFAENNPGVFALSLLAILYSLLFVTVYIFVKIFRLIFALKNALMTKTDAPAAAAAPSGGRGSRKCSKKKEI